MTRAQAMDVINDSTTIQSRIDAVLAAPILEWDHSPEINWQPGYPLYKYGEGGHVRNMIELLGVEFWETGEWDTEKKRPIREVRIWHDDAFDGDMSFVDCVDCLVGVGDEEHHCWNCGKFLFIQSRAEIRAEQEKKHLQHIAKMWREAYETVPVEDQIISHDGYEIPYDKIRWMADFARSNTNQSVRVCLRDDSMTAFRDFDIHADPVIPPTLVFQRDEVFALERMVFADMRRRQMLELRPIYYTSAPPSWDSSTGLLQGFQAPSRDYISYTESDVDVVTFIYNDMRSMLWGEINREFRNALWGDGLRELEPFEPHRPWVNTLFTNEDQPSEVGDVTIWEALTGLRNSIDWTPTPPRSGITIQWQTPQVTWAEHFFEMSLAPWQRNFVHAFYLADINAFYTPEPPKVDLPRISIESIRPDLYRPGYKQFFNEGDNNVRLPLPGSTDHRRGARGGRQRQRR
jgi:hypothetical protein